MTKDNSSKLDNQKNEEALPIIRRKFLADTAKLIVGAGVMAGGIQSAQAFQKADKSDVNYQNSPNGDERCADCRFFDGDSGCQIVEGTISADGWCAAFSAN